MDYFRDISTFGGCTAGPTAGLENLAIIEEENLLDNTVEQGAYMLDRLGELADKHSVIGQVRGKGLFLGAELVEKNIYHIVETPEQLADYLTNIQHIDFERINEQAVAAVTRRKGSIQCIIDEIQRIQCPKN